MSDGQDWDEFEDKAEDTIEYAQAVLDDPEHPHRDDFGGYARETLDMLLKWISRLESRLSVSCQRNAVKIATLKKDLADFDARAARVQSLAFIALRDPAAHDVADLARAVLDELVAPRG